MVSGTIKGVVCLKLGILSDIHGNYFALEAVLNSARKHNVDMILIAGDFIGYYFWPKEVFNLLSSWKVTAVRGNHEELLEKAHDNPVFLNQINKIYGCGLRIALNTLSKSQIEWLISLPHPCEIIIDKLRILLCHGSPWNINQYVYPDLEDIVLSKLSMMDYNCIILGHTHYPMIIRHNASVIVNPGSVGQPRNREPGAHWAMIDSETLEINMFQEQYDIDKVIDQAMKREPELPYLSEVLVRV